MKTIGFLISDQHLIAHGGIGQFCRSFIKMMHKQNNNVVLITDKKPRKGFVDEVNASYIFYPNTPLSYHNHRKTYGRFKEGVNYEKIANFATSLTNAENFWHIDTFVANSAESLAALTTHKTNAKKVLYTHLYKQIHPDIKFSDVFLPAYHTYFQQFLHNNDITVATQSEHNKYQLLCQGIKNVEVLPMPVTETALLESSDSDYKSGILFIGRWEVGKNPKDYLKVIKQMDFPAKVLTNKNGAKKFEKAFNEMGIKDYTIKAGIIGQEKIDFIKSCRIFFNTSVIECYQNAVVETIGHMPVVTLDKIKVPWINNFTDAGILNTSVKKAASLIQDIYLHEQVDNSLGLKFVNDLHHSAYEKWAMFLEK